MRGGAPHRFKRRANSEMWKTQGGVRKRTGGEKVDSENALAPDAGSL